MTREEWIDLAAKIYRAKGITVVVPASVEECHYMATELYDSAEKKDLEEMDVLEYLELDMSYWEQ